MDHSSMIEIALRNTGRIMKLVADNGSLTMCEEIQKICDEGIMMHDRLFKGDEVVSLEVSLEDEKQGMTLESAILRACEENDLIKALNWICVWESERIVDQAYNYFRTGVSTAGDGKKWDTCFEICLRRVIESWGMKTLNKIPEFLKKVEDDAGTPSTVFRLMVRDGDRYQYQDRSVNKVFEKKHLELFKVVSPMVGSVINLECSMRIDEIEYREELIVLWVTKMKNDRSRSRPADWM